MTRIIDTHGIVHFRNCNMPTLCLCGARATTGEQDLFGTVHNAAPFEETRLQVNCPGCARVVCAIRNEPYNTLHESITDAVRERAIYDSVRPDGPVLRGDVLVAESTSK